MRITDLLHTGRTITESQYKRLRPYGFKPVMCDKDRWNFSSVESMSEDEARKWIRELRMKREYEKENSIEPSLKGFVIHSENYAGEPTPKWPSELQPYQDKTDNILEAFLCHKFDIPCE